MGSIFKSSRIFFALLVVIFLVQSSVLAQGTVLADTGFRPQQNGFSFENYGNDSNPVNLTPASMQKIFGDRVCKTIQEGNCVLTATAQGWLNKINQDMSGGHCEGMAALSKLIYTGQVNLKDLDPNANTIADLKPDNPRVQEEIARWFATQYVPPTNSQEIRNQSPTQIVDTLVDQLKEGTGPFTMGIYQANGQGGHAITPYSVVDMGNGVVRVMVYDNNYPGQERFIEVDRNANTWKYTGTTNPNEPVSEYSGTASSFSLTLTPATARTTQPQQCTFCTPDDGGIGTEGNPGNTTAATTVPETTNGGTSQTGSTTGGNDAGGNPCSRTMIATGPDTDVSISTSGGAKNLINTPESYTPEDPNVTVVRPRSQNSDLAEDTPGAIISVPKEEGSLSIGVQSEGNSDVMVGSCGQYQQVKGLKQTDGEVDTVLFDPETGLLTVEVDPDEALTIIGGYDNPDGNDQTYILSDVSSEEGSVLAFGVDPETGDFVYASSGETSFDLQLIATDPDGEVHETELLDQSSSEGEALYLNLDAVIDDPEGGFEVEEIDPASFDEYFEESDHNLGAFEGASESIDENGDGIDDVTGEEIPADNEGNGEDGGNGDGGSEGGGSEGGNGEDGGSEGGDGDGS